MLCLLVCSRLVYLHTPRALVCVSCRFFQAALPIGALQMLAFVVHAALAIGALRVLVVTSLCYLHAALAIGALQMLVVKYLFICMLLLPSGLCRCLNFVVHAALASELCVYLHAALAIRGLQLREEFVVHAALAIGALQVLEFEVHAALAIGALQVLVIKSLYLFVRCSCHRGFADACSVRFVFICMLLLLSGLCRCLNLLCTLLLPPRLCSAFCDTFIFVCMLLLPSGLCRCL